MEATDDTDSSYAYNGKLMLSLSISLFLLLVFIILFHTYLLAWLRRRLSNHHAPHLSPSHNNAPPSNEGLDPLTLKSLPAFSYSPTAASSQTPRQLECAVCLLDFENRDQVRFLPNCHHTFHMRCIDAWFRSHSNCPLCRAPVHPPKMASTPEKKSPPGNSGVELGRVGPVTTQAGGSSLPPPVGCPRKQADTLGVIVEVPEGIVMGLPGGDGSKCPSDGRVLSFKRIWNCSPGEAKSHFGVGPGGFRFGGSGV